MQLLSPACIIPTGRTPVLTAPLAVRKRPMAGPRKVPGPRPLVAAPCRETTACVSLRLRRRVIAPTRQIQPLRLRRVRSLPPVALGALQMGTMRRAPCGGPRMDTTRHMVIGPLPALICALQRTARLKETRISSPKVKIPPTAITAQPRTPCPTVTGAVLQSLGRP